MDLRCVLLVESDDGPVQARHARSPFHTMIHVAAPACFAAAAVHDEADLEPAMRASFFRLVRLDHGGVAVAVEHSSDKWQANQHIFDAETCDTSLLKQ